MKAIVQDTSGSADVPEVRHIAPPSIGEKDVLVRVLAAGVDRGAWHLTTGQPYLMRILGFGFRSPKIPVPGTNVAGLVEAVGKNVTRFRVGDEVYGTCRGAFAEYARASPDKLASKPNSLRFEQAAVVPYGGLAAWQAVHDRGRVEAGQQVLVVAGSGAMGSFAVQLAKASGAEFTAVCSIRNVEMVRSLGADHVVEYTREDFADGRVRYDRIMDVFGRNSVSRLRRAVTTRGRLVIVGGEGTGGSAAFNGSCGATLLSPFVRQQLGTFVVKEHARYLLQLRLLERFEANPFGPLADLSLGVWLRQMMGSVTEASPVAEHWDQAYRLGEATCSWFQPTATQSLRMLDAAGITAADSVVDVGGGACRLVDELVARGFQDVTVLDVSAEAVRVAQDRLSELASRVRWLVRDVLTWEPHRTWRIWHDRAVLHFFSTPIARDAYLRGLQAATTTGSIAVIATFAPDGPEHCSGLPVARYDGRQLAELLGYAWQLVAVERELHTTPAGTAQPFTWTTFRCTREGNDRPNARLNRI